MTGVLLLNATYEPLRVLPWQRALRLLTCGRVEVVEEYDREIRTVNVVLRMPAVVRLRRYIPWHGPLPKFSRVNIYRRDDFTCQYCSTPHGAAQLNLDHVVPRAQGGQTRWENVVTSCLRCNARKGARTPEQAGMRLQRPPVKPTRLNSVMFSFNGSLPETWKQYLPS